MDFSKEQITLQSNNKDWNSFISTCKDISGRMYRAKIPSILYPDPVSFGQYDKFEICTVTNVIKEEMCKDCPPGLIPIYTIGVEIVYLG